jgi:hypothetical protein
MRRSNSFFYYSLLFVLIGLFSTMNLGSVSAVTVGPAKIEYRTNPGTVINDTLVLINEGETKQTFWPAFEKFFEIDGEKKFFPGEPTELSNWIKLSESITLEPKEQKIIPFTIEVPQNALAGGHFAVIWWGTAPEGQQQMSIVTRAGILVYLQVSGDVSESAQILKFVPEGEKFFWSKIPENFIVLFKNSGNTFLKPQGEINVKNIFGNKLVNLAVNTANIILLPNGEKNLQISKKFYKPSFAFGFYKAELNLRWGAKPEIIKKNAWFLVLSWPQALFSVIILVVLLFGLKKSIRKYSQRIVSKSAKQ